MIGTIQIHLPPVGIQVFIGVGMGFPVCAPLGGKVPVVGLISFLIGELGTGSGSLIEENILLLLLGGLHPQLGAVHIHIGLPSGACCMHAVQADILGRGGFMKLRQLPVGITLPGASGNRGPCTVIFPSGRAYLHLVLGYSAVGSTITYCLTGLIAQSIQSGFLIQGQLDIPLIRGIRKVCRACSSIGTIIITMPVGGFIPIQGVAGRAIVPIPSATRTGCSSCSLGIQIVP